MSWIAATYRVRASTQDIARIARDLALEQSVEVPADVVTDPFVADHIMGRVAAIAPESADCHRVAIRLASATTGFDAAQTINMLFGNSSLHEHVELVDVDFPGEYLARFRGPRHGIEGLRALLQAWNRPLTCAALKPQGLPVQRLADLCYTFAAGGVDVIKDDHGLADQRYSPFAQRVAACQRAIERARRETGCHAVYAPSLVGSPRAIAEQAGIARAEGAQMALIAPALVGMPVFEEMVREHLDVPILAHPAYAGAARVAPALLLGKLFRMFGADAVIYPNFGGRFAYGADTCAAIARNARSDWADFARTLPVPAGGLAVDRVPELVRFYGNDVMLLIGGSLLAAGDALQERVRAFVEAAAAPQRADSA